MTPLEPSKWNQFYTAHSYSDSEVIKKLLSPAIAGCLHFQSYHILFLHYMIAKKSCFLAKAERQRAMASRHYRREGVAPKFFKIILDPLAHTLRIPDEFMERYGQNLPNRVSLKIPSGSVVEVELIQHNGETLLQKGWQEFKERYSIGFGHFLVFEYDGNSQFDVLIFDTSASEINYPPDSDFEVEDNGTESDDSVVVLEHLSTSNRGKGKAKIVKESDTASDVSIKVLDFPLKRRHSKRVAHSRVKLEESTSEECSDGTRRQYSNGVQKPGAISKETSIAYRKALAFTTDHHSFRNPFFISFMQPSYVYPKFSLNVPLTFAKGNLPRKSIDLTIRLANGKAWSIRCNIRGSHSKLSTGWKDFVEDNGLKVGDACIFEVANKSTEDFVWNVIIFRS